LCALEMCVSSFVVRRGFFCGIMRALRMLCADLRNYARLENIIRGFEELCAL